jgi:predicted nucleic acid-binding protein
VSSLVIFDTSVFIDHLRTSRHTERIQAVTGLVRNSAVVLAELWRGANTESERRFLRALERNHPVLPPTIKNWLQSGEILRKIRIAMGFSPEKLRDLHFDVLIALTACSCGARLVTSNRADFESIEKHCPVEVEIW